MALIETDTKI